MQFYKSINDNVLINGSNLNRCKRTYKLSHPINRSSIVKLATGGKFYAAKFVKADNGCASKEFEI